MVLGLLALSSVAAAGVPPPVTTVITHGLIFTLGGPPNLPIWTIEMAEAIAARAGAGSVFIYDPPTGQWMGTGTPGPTDPVMLVFNWVDESDGGIFCPAAFPGPNWKYTEAAGDALYAALRDPSGALAGFDPLSGRDIHLIAHSRGPCVMDKTARLLTAAGFTVDHVTALDPHPVNNTLDQCLLFGTQIWGDPVPTKWAGMTFLDNYYRTDNQACDLDGMPLGFTDVLLPEAVLQTSGQGYNESHSDTHLWYHGTIDLAVGASDGEQTITSAMRTTWWTGGLDEAVSGWHYSLLGGGMLDRPAEAAGAPVPPQPTLINANFEQASYFGWFGHGGGGTGSIVSDANGQYLRLAPSGPARTHNWFFLPQCASAISLRYQVFTAGANDRLIFQITDRAGTVTTFNAGAIALDAVTGWVNAEVSLGGVAPGQSLLLTVRMMDSMGGALGATVGVDDLAFITGLTGDSNDDSVVNFDDILTTLANFNANYSPGTGPGDANGDGIVDFNDVLACLANFGATCIP